MTTIPLCLECVLSLRRPLPFSTGGLWRTDGRTKIAKRLQQGPLIAVTLRLRFAARVNDSSCIGLFTINWLLMVPYITVHGRAGKHSHWCPDHGCHNLSNSCKILKLCNRLPPLRMKETSLDLHQWEAVHASQHSGPARNKCYFEFQLSRVVA